MLRPKRIAAPKPATTSPLPEPSGIKVNPLQRKLALDPTYFKVDQSSPLQYKAVSPSVVEIRNEQTGVVHNVNTTELALTNPAVLTHPGFAQSLSQANQQAVKIAAVTQPPVPPQPATPSVPANTNAPQSFADASAGLISQYNPYTGTYNIPGGPKTFDQAVGFDATTKPAVAFIPPDPAQAAQQTTQKVVRPGGVTALSDVPEPFKFDPIAPPANDIIAASDVQNNVTPQDHADHVVKQAFNINNPDSQRAIYLGLATLARAFGRDNPNEPGVILATAAEKMLASSAEQEYLSRLLRGEDPAKAVKIPGLSEDGIQRANMVINARKQADQKDRELGIQQQQQDTQAKLADSNITLNKAQAGLTDASRLKMMNDITVDNNKVEIEKARTEIMEFAEKMNARSNALSAQANMINAQANKAESAARAQQYKAEAAKTNAQVGALNSLSPEQRAAILFGGNPSAAGVELRKGNEAILLSKYQAVIKGRIEALKSTDSGQANELANMLAGLQSGSLDIATSLPKLASIIGNTTAVGQSLMRDLQTYSQRGKYVNPTFAESGVYYSAPAGEQSVTVGVNLDHNPIISKDGVLNQDSVDFLQLITGNDPTKYKKVFIKNSNPTTFEDINKDGSYYEVVFAPDGTAKVYGVTGGAYSRSNKPRSEFRTRRPGAASSSSSTAPKTPSDTTTR